MFEVGFPIRANTPHLILEVTVGKGAQVGKKVMQTMAPRSEFSQIGRIGEASTRLPPPKERLWLA